MLEQAVFAWVSLGSNHDRHYQISRALDELSQHFGALRISQVYETQPVGISARQCAPFFNLIAGFNTSLSPYRVNQVLKSIEGSAKYLQPQDQSVYVRALDLDLVTHGSTTGLTDGVQLPYKHLLKHDFVLRPLAELGPNETAPGSDLTWAQLWAQHAHPEQQMQVVDFTWQGRQISLASS